MRVGCSDWYRPDVIVLVGDRHGNALLADCDAGYMYLRHLCAMQQVDLTTASSTGTGNIKIQFRLGQFTRLDKRH